MQELFSNCKKTWVKEKEKQQSGEKIFLKIQIKSKNEQANNCEAL